MELHAGLSMEELQAKPCSEPYSASNLPDNNIGNLGDDNMFLIILLLSFSYT